MNLPFANTVLAFYNYVRLGRPVDGSEDVDVVTVFALHTQ